MEVNFNNLRKQACLSLDRLTRKLNSNIDSDGEINIEAVSIQKQMDDLRMMIVSIACVFQPNDPEFIDVYDTLYTDGESMVQFNPNGTED